MTRVARRVLAAALPLLCAGAVVAMQQSHAYAATTATVDAATTYQPIEGFGFSQAFARTAPIRALSEANQKQVLDLIFSRDTGAGLSILRNGISSTASSIEPNNPGGPNATPQYVWDGDDDGQVWLSKQAQSYGVNRFYANAWSAPGYMKTNGNEANGGTLCGLPGASCSSGDWRKAYANYLIQYTKYYAQEGIPITDLGFTNEPNYTTNYSSMLFTPAQAADFARIIGPLANSAGLKLACCDPVGWEDERAYASATLADGYVQTFTGHHYSSGPSSPLSVGGRKTWMSEWSPGSSSSSWNTNWDDGSGIDGMTVANSIHTALTSGNVNAYIYWYAVSLNNTRAFMQANGTNYTVSKRLWAVAQYSRYIRPGAVRIGATTPDGNLRLSAFRNTDGSVVVVALNAGSSAQSTAYSLRNTVTTGTASPYLTNNTSSMAAQPGVAINNGTFTATVPARSLVTYRITGDVTTPPTSAPTTTPPTGGSCSATITPGTVWADRYNTSVTVTGSDNWSVTIALTSPQKVSTTWSGTFSWADSGYTMTVKPNGSGNTFGFTTMTNGNTTARPRITSCAPA
ncbi:glycoside hydrolase family 30 beta sandwich domain-containing protein [Paractinoplanes durhamensis]|uniref:CBM2 domain-containing protein n=1 Tax=Paractinoplanes durhamensis TaxID=113563 RepID=A0ABQ3ZE14_9ACTN|nr:glycoside hydrolase [Actinoplanes durhamensis]GIE08044.1 hypothetical protein Adu01nite_93940 [Actinoplanes durhamensis]